MNMSPNKLLQIKDLIIITGFSKSYIYLIMNKNSKYYLADFPKPFKVGLRKNYWDENSINQWISQTQLSHKLSAGDN